jgi:HD-like signal output (HDOD) protein
MHPHTILFVDDEQNILSSLRRLMRKEPWQTLFANNANESLQIMQQQKVDLVVSDMRMPDMDGSVFLKQVTEVCPETVRVILTGDADKNTVASMLQNEVAHQMLMKPWDPEELKALLNKFLDQGDMHNDAGSWLRNTFSDVQSLPTLPQIYLEIKEALAKSDDFSMKSIGQIIEQDPSISVRLLKWANSAIFGQRAHVDHVQRAVVVLGIEMVQGLVLSMSVFDAIKTELQEPKGYSRDGFWQHSLACGLASRWLGKHLGLGDQLSDRAFTAGLLHDLGKLFEDCYLHQGFVDAVDWAQAQQVTLRDAEKKVMHITHMETGSYLAQWWDLSPALVEVIRWHHHPHMIATPNKVLDIVHVANALVQQFGQGSSGNFEKPKVDQKIWEALNMSKIQLQELKEHIQQVKV